MSKLNILLCAYACEPGKGSEPEVGWGAAIVLAQKDAFNNYFVITRRNNKEIIESQDYPKNLSFIYFELPNFFLKLKKAGNLTRIYYYLWMFGAVSFLRKSKMDFDIIHHITFVNDWLPSLFINLKKKNNVFIWGPIGSHDEVPRKFLSTKKDRLIEFFRIKLQWFFRSFDPYFRKCINHSDLILGINQNVSKKLRLSADNFLVTPAIAMKDDLRTSVTLKNTEEFKILSIGRLIHIKNFKLTLRTFSKFIDLIDNEKKDKVTITIIGSGNQEEELIKITEELCISNYVKFINYLPQDQLMRVYEESDLFLFPTLESAGFVILEAMSKGLPIVAVDYGGPGQFIKQKREQQLVDPDLLIEDIEDKMSSLLFMLFDNKTLRNEIGLLNKNTIKKEFTWEAKAELYINIYINVVK